MRTRKVYDKLLDICYGELHEYQPAFDALIEFLVIDHSPLFIKVIPDGMKWLDEDHPVRNKLLEFYTMDIVKQLKDDWDDHLGDIYVESQGAWSKAAKGQFFTPQNVCYMMAMMTMAGYDDEKEGRPPTVFDPCVGSGRMFLAAAKVNPEVRCYGVDIDLNALHIAICNCAIHDIHGFFLHADSIRHEVDIEYMEGRKNWSFANRWTSHWNELIETGSVKHKIESRPYKVTTENDSLVFRCLDLNDPEKVHKRREQIKGAYGTKSV